MSIHLFMYRHIKLQNNWRESYGLVALIEPHLCYSEATSMSMILVIDGKQRGGVWGYYLGFITLSFL